MSVAAALLLGATCAAGVEIKPGSNGGLDLEAKQAPISAVLECLSVQTGLKVTNPSGVISSRKLTLSLRGKTEVQLISELLSEGGLNYGLTTDRSGTHVAMLILVGLRAKTGGAAGAAGSPGPLPLAPLPVFDELDVAPAPAADPAVLQEELRARARTYNPERTGPGVWPLSPTSATEPAPASPYPEARALSPMSLREANRVPRASGKTSK